LPAEGFTPAREDAEDDDNDKQEDYYAEGDGDVSSPGEIVGLVLRKGGDLGYGWENGGWDNEAGKDVHSHGIPSRWLTRLIRLIKLFI